LVYLKACRISGGFLPAVNASVEDAGCR